MEVVYSDQVAGPDVVSPSVEEVVAAIAQVDEQLDWSDVGPHIVPLLERARPYPAGAEPRLWTLVPPGVTISLAIDIGPGYIHVTREMLAQWSMSVADVTAAALANLHQRASTVEATAVIDEIVDGVPVRLLQTGLGIGSVLPLAPTELMRLFGRQPRMLMAPMRDLIFGLPPAEYELAEWLYTQFAQEDPNCLVAVAFHFDGGAVSVEHAGQQPTERLPPRATTHA